MSLPKMKVAYLDYDDKDKLKLAIDEAVKFLRQGKVIVYPTDTLYGLGCDARNEEAVKKIFQIKKRESQKPLSVIVRDISAIGEIAFVDHYREEIAISLFPGPYTLIFPGVRNIPEIITAGENSIGVRIPDNRFTHMLSKYFENPIVATSVNISGDEPLSDPFKIVEHFKTSDVAPDLVLDGGKIKDPHPSVVIDITRKSPQIVRSGMMSTEDIRILLNKLNQI